MSSYYVETHRSKRKDPRDFIPATVRRYPVHRVPVAIPKPPPPPPAPASAAPPAPVPTPTPKEEHTKEKEKAKAEKTTPPKENPKEAKEAKEEEKKAEEKAASEPAPAPAPVPEWSTWQRLEESQWDGYWRAKAHGDNHGWWTYQFTRDFTTIWEQKPAEQQLETKTTTTTTNKKSSSTSSSSSSSSSSGASSTTTSAGEPPVRTQQSPTTILPPLDSSPSSSYAVDENDVIYASYGDVAVATTTATTAADAAAADLDMDMSGLTLGSLYSSQTPGSPRQAPKKRRHNTKRKQKTKRPNDYNHDNYYHYDEQEDVDDYTAPFFSHHQEAAIGTASTPAQESGLEHHYAGTSRRGRKAQAHHAAHSQSKQAHRDSHRLGAIVSRDKGKRFDSRRIVETWQQFG